MDGKDEIKTKTCSECMQELPLPRFASHMDKKNERRYYRHECRDCASLKRNAGKPHGIARKLTPQVIEKIKANADLFDARSTAAFYELVQPGVSIGIWYRAVKNGEIAKIMQG